MQLTRQSTETESANRAERELQRYLDALEKPLDVAGAEAQREWRAEAESHLRSMVTAYEELGDTREEAVRAALAHFGNTRRIGWRMRRESQRIAWNRNPRNTAVKRLDLPFFVANVPSVICFGAFVYLLAYSDDVALQFAVSSLVTPLVVAGALAGGLLLGKCEPQIRRDLDAVRTAQGRRGLALVAGPVAFVLAVTITNATGMHAMIRSVRVGVPESLTFADFVPVLWAIAVAIIGARVGMRRSSPGDRKAVTP